MTKPTQEQITSISNKIRKSVNSGVHHISSLYEAKIILAALEAYRQPQVSNEEALEALEKMHKRIEIVDSNFYWHKEKETIRAAITQQPKAVDVEELKKGYSGEETPMQSDVFNMGWNVCLDYLKEKGYINAK